LKRDSIWNFIHWLWS